MCKKNASGRRINKRCNIFSPLHWFAHKKRVLAAREMKCKATVLESCASCWGEELLKKYQKEKSLWGLWHIWSSGNTRMKQKRDGSVSLWSPMERSWWKNNAMYQAGDALLDGFPHCIAFLVFGCAVQGGRISNIATCMQPCSHNTVVLLIRWHWMDQ